jgi:hypothetical protein
LVTSKPNPAQGSSTCTSHMDCSSAAWSSLSSPLRRWETGAWWARRGRAAASRGMRLPAPRYSAARTAAAGGRPHGCLGHDSALLDCLAGRSALSLEPGDGGHRGMPRDRRGKR